jgi:adenylate cyclase
LRRWRYRALTSLVCAVAAGAATFLAGPPITWDGPIFDLLLNARTVVFPERERAQSRVVVVALDGRSLVSPELEGYPRVLLSPVWAKLLPAIFGAGASTVGFDFIFSYDANRFPALDPNFNQTFLAAMAANKDRVVLARSARIAPAPAFSVIVGSEGVGSSEIQPDPDGRYRHVPAAMRYGSAPGLAAAVLKRADQPPMPSEVLLAPRRSLEEIPTYSVIDVLRCAVADPRALAAALRGKIVLIGGTLPEDDRKVSSDRFITRQARDGAPLAPCGLRMLGASAPSSETVPGVFLHAGAIEAVSSGQLTATATPVVVAIISALAAAAAALAGLYLAPWTALVAVAAMACLLFSLAVVELQRNYWIPLMLPLLATFGSPVVAYVARYLAEERLRNRIEHAFGRYLSPVLVDRLANDSRSLKLGGEAREVTVMFADLSGFTVASTQMTPEELTSKVNRYFHYIVEPVDETGGYIERFVGDAVMGMWGAPLSSSDHAVNAIRAAMAIVDGVQRAREEDESRGEKGFTIKVGINSGTAVVGNIGSENRYSYTAMGEDVNFAARLESVPPLYGCLIVAGEHTARLAQSVFLMRELDWLLVKGAGKPMSVYQPIAELDSATEPQKEVVARFAHALEHYRTRRFADACAIWDYLARVYEPAPSPSSVMAARSRELISNPPDESWNGVHVLVNK